jgi:hypothetical protein
MSKELPLFTLWYETLALLLERVGRFPKGLRPTLGQRIIDRALDVMELVVELRYSKDRRALFGRANLALEQLRVLTRVGHELRSLSTRQYEQLAERIDATGRMLGGWRRSTEALP